MILQRPYKFVSTTTTTIRTGTSSRNCQLYRYCCCMSSILVLLHQSVSTTHCLNTIYHHSIYTQRLKNQQRLFLLNRIIGFDNNNKRLRYWINKFLRNTSNQYCGLPRKISTTTTSTTSTRRQFSSSLSSSSSSSYINNEANTVVDELGGIKIVVFQTTI
jgi:hypothetical protein